MDYEKIIVSFHSPYNLFTYLCFYYTKIHTERIYLVYNAYIFNFSSTIWKQYYFEFKFDLSVPPLKV